MKELIDIALQVSCATFYPTNGKLTHKLRRNCYSLKLFTCVHNILKVSCVRITDTSESILPSLPSCRTISIVSTRNVW